MELGGTGEATGWPSPGCLGWPALRLATMAGQRERAGPGADVTLPQTRYASLGGADIAYQVLGEGPLDLVYANGLTEHIDVQWEHPLMPRFLERLASFSRLIMFDRRGAGASDPVP